MTDPEIRIEQLQPIDFGPNDDDRVKDMFEKVFLAEYRFSRKDGLGMDGSTNNANYSASVAAKIYREWLKEQNDGNA